MDIKTFRIRNKVTQLDMAASLGVSLTTIILWERGINTPTEDNQKKIDEFMGKYPKEA